MVERRSQLFRRGLAHARGIFGIEERRPDLLDALDARLRLQGYSPVIRCIAVGLGLAASIFIFFLFLDTIEIQNLIYLLWLGGVLHQVVNRPRGVPVQWTRFIVTAAIPAINLLGQMVA